MKDMRPDIYPRTVENIKAVFLYYFPDEKHSAIDAFAEKVYDERGINLNEIEYIAEQIAKNKEILMNIYNTNNMNNKLGSFFGNTRDALLKDETSWSGSANRLIILKAIKNQL